MKKLIYFTLLVSLFPFTACQNKKEPQSSGYIPAPAKGLKTVYYDYDDSSIREDQITVLDNNGDVIKSGSQTITVEGHCDERGTNEYNLALGDRRARSAKNYLINRGVDPAKLNVMSYGEERPTCMGHDESCWWQNRRAEFIKF